MKGKSMLSPWLSIPMGVFITAYGIVKVYYFTGQYWMLLGDICLIFTGVSFLASKFNEIRRAPRLQLLSIASIIVVVICLAFMIKL
jgi:hypothetical protein